MNGKKEVEKLEPERREHVVIFRRMKTEELSHKFDMTYGKSQALISRCLTSTGQKYGSYDFHFPFVFYQ